MRHEDYDRAREYTPQARATLITYRLCLGEALTTERVATLTGLTVRGAWYLMQNVCMTAPVTYFGGLWQIPDEFLVK